MNFSGHSTSSNHDGGRSFARAILNLNSSTAIVLFNIAQDHARPPSFNKVRLARPQCTCAVGFARGVVCRDMESDAQESELVAISTDLF